ncbi:unnamed protein product [Microthlaspi erraticum]|uniref:DUF1985 domain-containing protein n=1 Tax=Microthlaspi erraticum TaxID=1685480 RepID=A0A6D2I572_9BRAS|nr:unnamed protein product [Microthlaspi erraticum]
MSTMWRDLFGRKDAQVTVDDAIAMLEDPNLAQWKRMPLALIILVEGVLICRDKHLVFTPSYVDMLCDMNGGEGSKDVRHQKRLEKKEKQGVKPLRRGVPKRKRGRDSRDRSKSVRKLGRGSSSSAGGAGNCRRDEEWMLGHLNQMKEALLVVVAEEREKGKEKVEGGGSTDGKENARAGAKGILEDLGNLLRDSEAEPLYKKPRVVGWEGDDNLNRISDEEGQERTGVDEDTSTWKYYGGTLDVLAELGVDKLDRDGNVGQELGVGGERGTVVVDGGKTNRKDEKVVDAGDEGNEDLLVEEKENEGRDELLVEEKENEKLRRRRRWLKKRMTIARKVIKAELQRAKELRNQRQARKRKEEMGKK